MNLNVAGQRITSDTCQEMKKSCSAPDTLDRGSTMGFIVHAADISHPTKVWDLHSRWTDGLVEEFFRQGDAERELGIPFSPLCDRESTLVSQSQIGFIDFIISPTYTVVCELFTAVNSMLESNAEAIMNGKGDQSAFQTEEILRKRLKTIQSQGLRIEKFREQVNSQIASNHEVWREKAQEDRERMEKIMQEK